MAITVRIFRGAVAAALLVSAPAATAFGSAGTAAAADGPARSAEYHGALNGNSVIGHRPAEPGEARLLGSDIEDFSASSGASGTLTARLAQQSANTAELAVDDSGGDLDTYFTVQVTGLGGYTVTATPANVCAQSGTKLNCAYSTPLSSNSSTVSITLAFSGGSGPVDLAATVTGYLLDAAGIALGAGETAKATLDWAPGRPGSASGGSTPGGGSGAGSGGSSGGGVAGSGTYANVVPIPALGTAGAGDPGAGPGAATPQARSAPSTQSGSGSTAGPTHLGAGSTSGGSGVGGWLPWGLAALAVALAGAGGGCLYIARRRTRAAYAAAAAYVPPAFDPRSVDLDTLEHRVRSSEKN